MQRIKTNIELMSEKGKDGQAKKEERVNEKAIEEVRERKRHKSFICSRYFWGTAFVNTMKTNRSTNTKTTFFFFVVYCFYSDEYMKPTTLLIFSIRSL